MKVLTNMDQEQMARQMQRGQMPTTGIKQKKGKG